MEYNIDNLFKCYEKDGYVHLKNFFSNDNIQKFKNNFSDEKFKNYEIKGSYELSIDDTYGSLLFDQKLSKVLNILLNNDCVYFGESGLSGNYKLNKILKRWMHTDTRGNSSNPFGRTYYDPSKKIYPLLAVFIYLEDYTNYSGGIKISKGSHRKFLPTIGNYLKIFLNISKDYKFDGKYSIKAAPFLNFLKLRNISTKPGDLFIFNMALHHSANSCKLKIFPNLALPVFFENFFLKYFPFIFKSDPESRKIISMVFGKHSIESENFIRSRVKYVNKEYFEKSRFFKDEEFRMKMNERGFKTNINMYKYFRELSDR